MRIVHIVTSSKSRADRLESATCIATVTGIGWEGWRKPTAAGLAAEHKALEFMYFNAEGINDRFIGGPVKRTPEKAGLKGAEFVHGRDGINIPKDVWLTIESIG
jgi:hypothetical protein